MKFSNPVRSVTGETGGLSAISANPVNTHLRQPREAGLQRAVVPEIFEVGIHRAVERRDQADRQNSLTTGIGNQREARVVHDVRVVETLLDAGHEVVIGQLGLGLRDRVLLDRHVKRKRIRHCCASMNRTWCDRVDWIEYLTPLIPCTCSYGMATSLTGW